VTAAVPAGACHTAPGTAIVPVYGLPRRGGHTIKSLLLIVAAMAFNSPAIAAGVDSHAYSCAGLHALIAANRWIFINNPDFEDIVVADAHVCSMADQEEWRSVPTTDNPQCIVFHCGEPHGVGTKLIRPPST
jgi:hypothetical protein